MIKKALLDSLAREKNTQKGLFEHPDPLQIASIYKDEHIALLCALFAYGNAKNIVSFLNKLDFGLLKESEENIKKAFNKNSLKYRFQNSQDIKQIFITFKRLKSFSLNEIALKAYEKEQNILEAIFALQKKLYSLNTYESRGYNFFLNKINKKSAFKRYNMYFRWMVRKDELDLGLFKGIDKKDLLIPLDTHTHKVALKYGLMYRKSCDLKAVLELSSCLKGFDANDPCKYDFALYRLGQLYGT